MRFEKMIGLSIIIPVYNNKEFLPRCLESIRTQKYRNYECIIVDDGSTDGSQNICDDFVELDERFRVFHIKNKGVSNARNYGLDIASGEFVTFVDSDDFIDENTYQDVMNRIHTFDVCCFGIKRLLPDGTEKSVPFRCRDLSHSFVRYDVYMHSVCNKVFRRSLIELNHLRFSSELTIWEDMIFSFEVLSSSRNTVYIPNHYYTYRRELPVNR